MTTASKPPRRADKRRPHRRAEQGQYTARDIQVLGGLEAVRRRPGMYIGSTDQRGLHHLVYEIADNAIDEGMAGFCDHIEVVLARRRPRHRLGQRPRHPRRRAREDGQVGAGDGHDRSSTPAASSAAQVYKVSGGLHGVGASVVNALSEKMWAEVRRGGKAYVQEYERGIPVSDVRQESEPRYRSSWQARGMLPASVNGTTISFLPDQQDLR